MRFVNSSSAGRIWKYLEWAPGSSRRKISQKESETFLFFLVGSPPMRGSENLFFARQGGEGRRGREKLHAIRKKH